MKETEGEESQQSADWVLSDRAKVTWRKMHQLPLASLF